MPDDSFLAAVERAPQDDLAFGAWTPRPFTGTKAGRGIIAASRPHEDYLMIASLDPAVTKIEPAPADLFAPGIPGRPDFVVTDVDGGEACVHVLAEEGDEAGKAALLEAYREAERARLTYRVVDLDEICRQPRLLNARLVHGCRRVRVSPGDRVRILQFLKDSGEVPLIEVSQVVANQAEAIECVLALALEGTVAVDLRRTLAPEMPVRRLHVESDAEMD